MHAIEKILAKASHKNLVTPGEIVTAEISFAEINDLYLQTIKSFYEMNGEYVWDKERLAFVFDHYAPAPTIATAEIHKKMRGFRRQQELVYHFDINAGVCHQVMTEQGVICPGDIIAATDSHTTTHGALGAFGTGVGATDMATIMLTGKLWLKVPEIIEIRLEGTPGRGIMPKDVILYVLGKLGADGTVYKAVEYTGDYVKNLDLAGRMVLCNMAVEMGAKTAYIQPDERILSYVKKRAVRPYEVQYTDEDFVYAKQYVFDISEIEPQIAVPSSVDHVLPISQVKSCHVDQCFIGACTGGRLEDLKAAADILRGKKVADHTRLIVIPASGEVLKECIKQGILQDLLEAGAVISTPGCGPCLSAHEGVLAKGEVCVTASNRNFPGRMGHKDSRIYLASPAVVAATALTGTLTDVRELYEGGLG